MAANDSGTAAVVGAASQVGSASQVGTMLSDSQVAAFAAALDEAERTRTQMAQLTLQEPDLTFDDAYRIQRAWVDMKLARGRTVAGQKIGLTSRSMQRSVGIDEPDSGVLLDDMVFANNEDVPFSRFIVPMVEVELAFVLGSDLHGPDCRLVDVLRAVDYVLPAVEIIDARVPRIDPASGRRRTVRDTIADNAANAGIITGGRPVRPDAVDLRWTGALLHHNGVIEDSGLAAAVLGHPGNGIAWLANRVARNGGHLAAGELVLAGSFTAPLPVAQGDVIHVDFGALGSISVRFA